VGLVIAPWNFPLAISVVMAFAAPVAGNAVLYKPSRLSPANGWLAFSLLREGGVPDRLSVLSRPASEEVDIAHGEGGLLGGEVVRVRGAPPRGFAGAGLDQHPVLVEAHRSAGGDRFERLADEVAGERVDRLGYGGVLVAVHLRGRPQGHFVGIRRCREQDPMLPEKTRSIN
jgi:hypothetical protein